MGHVIGVLRTDSFGPVRSVVGIVVSYSVSKTTHLPVRLELVLYFWDNGIQRALYTRSALLWARLSHLECLG